MTTKKSSNKSASADPFEKGRAAGYNEVAALISHLNNELTVYRTALASSQTDNTQLREQLVKLMAQQP